MSFIENRLAIMVKKNNPKHIPSLQDLARPGLRLALPNPETEGIARKIRTALQQAGGERLAQEVLENKIQRGEAYRTQIHHRQTPLWILKDQADAGLTWLSEVKFQQRIGHPIGLVSIAPEHNQRGIEAAALVKGSRHPKRRGRGCAFSIPTPCAGSSKATAWRSPRRQRPDDEVLDGAVLPVF